MEVVEVVAEEPRLLPEVVLVLVQVVVLLAEMALCLELLWEPVLVCAEVFESVLVLQALSAMDL